MFNSDLTTLSHVFRSKVAAQDATRYVLDSIIDDAANILYERYLDTKVHKFAAERVTQDVFTMVGMASIPPAPGEPFAQLIPPWSVYDMPENQTSTYSPSRSGEVSPLDGYEMEVVFRQQYPDVTCASDVWAPGPTPSCPLVDEWARSAVPIVNKTMTKESKHEENSQVSPLESEQKRSHVLSMTSPTTSGRSVKDKQTRTSSKSTRRPQIIDMSLYNNHADLIAALTISSPQTSPNTTDSMFGMESKLADVSSSGVLDTSSEAITTRLLEQELQIPDRPRTRAAEQPISSAEEIQRRTREEYLEKKREERRRRIAEEEALRVSRQTMRSDKSSSRNSNISRRTRQSIFPKPKQEAGVPTGSPAGRINTDVLFDQRSKAPRKVKELSDKEKNEIRAFMRKGVQSVSSNTATYLGDNLQSNINQSSPDLNSGATQRLIDQAHRPISSRASTPSSRAPSRHGIAKLYDSLSESYLEKARAESDASKKDSTNDSAIVAATPSDSVLPSMEVTKHTSNTPNPSKKRTVTPDQPKQATKRTGTSDQPIQARKRTVTADQSKQAWERTGTADQSKQARKRTVTADQPKQATKRADTAEQSKQTTKPTATADQPNQTTFMKRTVDKPSTQDSSTSIQSENLPSGSSSTRASTNERPYRKASRESSRTFIPQTSISQRSSRNTSKAFTNVRNTKLDDLNKNEESGPISSKTKSDFDVRHNEANDIQKKSANKYGGFNVKDAQPPYQNTQVHIERKNASQTDSPDRTAKSVQSSRHRERLSPTKARAVARPVLHDALNLRQETPSQDSPSVFARSSVASTLRVSQPIDDVHSVKQPQPALRTAGNSILSDPGLQSSSRKNRNVYGPTWERKRQKYGAVNVADQARVNALLNSHS